MFVCVKTEGFTELQQIAQAYRLSCPFLCGDEYREENRRQDRDDRDNYQELDERKTCFF